jgi:TatD DNase family protein
MPFPAIDSHAHLTDARLAGDLAAVLDRARAAALDAVITVATAPGEIARVAELARREPMLHAAVGFHPHVAADIKAVDWPLLEDLAGRPEVVALGEFGLDYHYEHSPRPAQREVFAAGVRLAADRDLPLVIHSREADADTLSVLDAADRLPRGVFHCFTGSPALAEEALARGFYVSFSGIATFPKSETVREAARRVPLERLLAETDAPYCAPVPMRGKTNEPAYVVHVLRCLAEVRGLSENDVRRITRRNASRLFGLPLAEGEATLVYPIRRSLYVNLTNRCTSGCTFCPRAADEPDLVVKGHDLRLAREPEVHEIVEALEAARPENYTEIVFCGFGEPTLRLDVLKRVAAEVKRRWGLPVRLDTNGHGSAIAGRDVTDDLAGLVDTVSVSLNAPDAATYGRLCAPSIPNAFEAVCDFIRACKGKIPEVRATAVAVPGLDVEAVRRLAEEELGVAFRVREYNEVG